MKRLIVLVLCVNAGLLAARAWQKRPAAAQGGGEPDPCPTNPACYAIDANGDGEVDISDPVYILTWLFGGGEEPRVCLAQPCSDDFLEELRFGHRVAGTWVVGAPGQPPYAILTFGADGTAVSNDANDFTGGLAPGLTPGFHSAVRWTWRRIGDRQIRLTGLFGVFNEDGSPWGTSRLTGELEFSEDFETFTGTICERSFEAPQDPLDLDAEPDIVLGPDVLFARRLPVLDPLPCE